MPPHPPFPPAGGGPAPDATVLVVERPTRPALGCVGAIAVFLAVIAGAALAYAAGGFTASAATTPRVVCGIAGGVFLALLVLLVAALVSTLRQVEALAVDGRGVWWSGRGGPVVLPWSVLAAARVVPPTGPKRGRSGRPTLELFPTDDETVRRAVSGPHASHGGLRERVSAGEAPGEGLPSLRFAFRLPATDAADRLSDAVAAAAPAGFALLPRPDVDVSRRRRPARRARG